MQFLYMKRIIDNLAFDQIYHEHLLYYNLNTIEVLLNRHGSQCLMRIYLLFTAVQLSDLSLMKELKTH